MQYLRYFHRIKRNLYPTKAFAADLVEFIKSSLWNSFEIVLCIDANKNIKEGQLAKELKKLGLAKTTSRFTSEVLPNTFIIGQH
jgi:hypothetical protein